jgi:RNA polymerase sigma factor (TIGR02999 family)
MCENSNSSPVPDTTDPHSITRLLELWRDGQPDALNTLMRLLYHELRAMAHRVMSGEAPGQTMPATALVHEAFLRLSGAQVEWQNRSHFLAVAGRTMRRVLVDHARSRGREKRGGKTIQVNLEEALLVAQEPPELILDLDDALGRLESFDERKGRIVEMMYFGGMSHDETAEVLGISRATVQREARLAKAWLYNELQGTCEG